MTWIINEEGNILSDVLWVYFQYYLLHVFNPKESEKEEWFIIGG